MDSNRLRTASLQAHWDRLKPQLRWQVGRLGNGGKLGIGLLAASAIYYFLAIMPQETELQQLKDRAVMLQAQAMSKKAVGDGVDDSGRKLSGDQALQVFYDFFPRIDSSPFWIRELTQLAKKHGVELSSSEYRLVSDNEIRLARYEMVLPVKGKYPQIRAFIAAALEAVPAMAITAIAIKRENTTADKLEARLEINLYLNK